jgi:hypothetical protein
MRFLCEAYTDGGPVAIIPYENRSLWDGNEDYFRVIGTLRTSCLQFISNFKNACDICIFHQVSDGNFHVFYDRSTLVVLGEISADEGFEIRNHLPPIPRAIRDTPPVVLDSFGGKVLIFDAAMPGDAIKLQEVGCEQVSYGTKAVIHRYDAAVVEIDAGKWQAFELHWNDNNLSFCGVLFQIIR